MKDLAQSVTPLAASLLKGIVNKQNALNKLLTNNLKNKKW